MDEQMNVYEVIGIQQMQDNKSYQTNSDKKTNYSFTTPTKDDIDKKKQKRKKMAAFKTFLGKIQSSQMTSPLPPMRKYSGQLVEEKVEGDIICKICTLPLSEKSKQCMFCGDTICISHIRKKRRDPRTNKFVRICDLCEDTYLYKKYLKSQIKLEQSLIAQQSLLEIKLKELKEMASGKRTKLAVLKQKNEDLENKHKKDTQKFNTQEANIQKRLEKLVQKEYDNIKQQNEMKSTEKKMPRSLQNDYEVLVQEDEKITRDLVIHEKICNDVVKAISQRQKTMYEEYYAWEEQQKLKREEEEKKNQQDCLIY